MIGCGLLCLTTGFLVILCPQLAHGTPHAPSTSYSKMRTLNYIGGAQANNRQAMDQDRISMALQKSSTGLMLNPATDKSVHAAVDDLLTKSGYRMTVLWRAAGKAELYAMGAVGSQGQIIQIDTGLNMTQADPAIARQAKSLGQLETVLDDAILGQLTDEKILLLERLSLGGLMLANQPAAPRTFPDANRMSWQGVVVGCDLLLRNGCLLDCRAGRLYFPGGKPTAQGQQELEAALRQEGYTAVALQTNAGPVLTCELRLKGKPVRMLIRTSSSRTWLTDKAAEAAGLSYTQTNGTGKAQIRMVEPESLQLGALELEKVPMMVGDLGDHVPEQGVLGAGLLNDCEALIDFGQRRMWLRPPAKVEQQP